MRKPRFLTFISSLREGPTRPSRPRLRNENPPPPTEKHFALQPVSTKTVPIQGTPERQRQQQRPQKQCEDPRRGWGTAVSSCCEKLPQLARNLRACTSPPSLTRHHVEPLPPTARRTSHAGSSYGEEELEAKLLALHQDVLSRLLGLPDRMATSIKAALLARTATSMMATNSDPPAQPSEVDEIQALVLLRPANASTSQLKMSDVTIESQQERLLELEKATREINRLLYPIAGQFHFAANHWEDLRRANEQLERLAVLLSQAQTNKPELKELRRVSERTKVLESEHIAHSRVRFLFLAFGRPYCVSLLLLVFLLPRAHLALDAILLCAYPMRGIQVAEDRAAQLDKKDAKEHLAKDRESKPRGQVSPQASSRTTVQVARLEACGAAYT
ncbi:hypothetical protein EDB85DRAFT_2212192 [Lactarius pseudohatsudake]|nr:hypothetical protein EDB85DRAFT_2212192 [Lactarius pseudohatsudake]